jgi:predicted nucleic acid-binding protein
MGRAQRVLVDTSVWEAARKQDRDVRARLERLLEDDLVVSHPFVVGECALGGADVARAFAGIDVLPLLDQSGVVGRVGALGVIGRKGVGWVDTNLIASALQERVDLWTLNRALAEAHGDAAARWGPSA